MQTQPPFSGTGVAVVTPFNDDLSVDTEGLERIIRHLIQGQVEYLVILGTTGEVATLTHEERLLVIDTVYEANQGVLPIVLGAGGNNTASVCQTIQEYDARYQPSAILSVSPYYNKPSQEGLYAHYKQVAASTDLPIILYNVPPRTASNMSAETTLRLAHDISNIVGIKEASGDLEQCMTILKGSPSSFFLTSGDDLLTIPLVAMGGVGLISVSANALPAQFGQMVRKALAGNFGEARLIHNQIMSLVQLNFREGNPTGVKLMMEALGLCKSTVRLPLQRGSDKLLTQMKSELEKLTIKKG